MVSEGNGSERALGFYQDENIGVVRMTGADRVKFVHNMSTNNLVLLKEGQTRLTTLTNNKGRTYDLITVFIDKDQLIMLMSADAVDGILENFDKYASRCIHKVLPLLFSSLTDSFVPSPLSKDTSFRWTE